MIRIYKISKVGKGVIQQNGDTLIFVVGRPLVIQPAEIMRVPLNLVMEMDPGYVLTLTTHPELISKATEIFPSAISLDSEICKTYTNGLEIAVRNCGRNPIHLSMGDKLAVGHLSRQLVIKLEESEYSSTERDVESSRPQKKNTGIKFELRN